jgi:hypothetical protein
LPPKSRALLKLPAIGGHHQESTMFGFDTLFGTDSVHTVESRINPANGLPMIENSSFDIAGNPYGSDFTGSGFSLGGGFGNGFDL